MAERERTSRAELERRLREVRAALQEVPPHAGAGVRERLDAELLRLQRRLEELSRQR